MSHESTHTARGIVAAPHTLAVEAGRQVLAEGGNAVEAALATAVAIAVVYPHMNHLGGDGFWLIREPNGRVRYIEACGFAGTRATIKSYRD
ncbi:gamma-glutamyltransferase, partial [Azorhizobium caulinodans]